MGSVLLQIRSLGSEKDVYVSTCAPKWQAVLRGLTIGLAAALVVLLAWHPLAVSQAQSTSGSVIHIVRWGENLTTIAARYGVTVQAIVQANGLANPNWIYVGQRLVIPTTPPPAPQPSGTVIRHVIQRGDTLSALAVRYGCTISAIVQANRLINPSYIWVGQVLLIPSGGSTVPAQGVYYRVRAGDTLARIAYRYGVSSWAVAQANNLYNPSLIHVGQLLLIPGGSEPAPRTPTAVEGWVGIVASNPPGAQYDDYFEDATGGRYGISSSDGQVLQKLIELRNTGRVIQVWGKLARGVPDVNGVQIDVTRFQELQSSAVESWTGKIIKLPAGAQYDDYFERDDGTRYGIGSTSAAIEEQIKDFRWSGALIRVWGQLLSNTADYNGSQIVVSRIEIVWEPGMPTPTPGPTSTPVPGTTPTPVPTSAVLPTCVPPTTSMVPLGPVPLPSPGPSKPVRMSSPEYGMEVNVWGVGDCITDRDLRLVKDAGFTWAKQLFRWRDIEAKKGQFEWREADRIVAMAAKYNLDLAIAVAYQPEWAGGGYPLNGPPNNMADFADFMGALAKRYQGLVRAYEIWPGPNVKENWGGQSPDPTRYAEMLIDAYWYVKRADPFAIVISGGLVQGAKHDATMIPPISFFQTMYDVQGVRNAADAFGVEALGFKAAPENTPEDAAKPDLNNHYPATAELNRTWCFRSIEVLYQASLPPSPYPRPDRQWVVTRLGWTTDTRERSFTRWAAVSEETKADLLRRAYSWAKQNWSGWIGVMFVPLTDARATPQNDVYWWSVVNPDGSARAAYYALKGMAK